MGISEQPFARNVNSRFVEQWCNRLINLTTKGAITNTGAECVLWSLEAVWFRFC
jgi:hypothetical protein